MAAGSHGLGASLVRLEPQATDFSVDEAGALEMRIVERGMWIEKLNSEIRNPNSEIGRPVLPAGTRLAPSP